MLKSNENYDPGLNYFQRLRGRFIPSFLKSRENSSVDVEGKSWHDTYFSRNCERATIEPVEGRVQGEIPWWLEGTLIRNGPGITKVGEDEYNHIFDGLAVLHRFHIQNGKVTYTSRPLESDAYRENMSANRIVVGEFGTVSFRDPCKSLFQRLQATFEMLRGKADMTDNCNVNVAYFGDQLYALTETNFIRRIDPKDLKTVGPKTNVKDYVVVNHSTAHPHTLPDGSLLNLGNNFEHRRGPRCCVIKIPPTFGKEETALRGAKILAEIPLSSSVHLPYYHSFGMTTEHIIFIESPLRMNLFKFLSAKLRAAAFSSALSWRQNLKAKFNVVSFTNGHNLPIVYEADPFFAFHHINAFEEDGQIVVDVVAYDDGKLLENLDHKTSEKWELNCNARRFGLPLSIQGAIVGQNLVTLETTKAKATLVRKESKSKPAVVHLEPEQLSTMIMELPAINYKYNGRPYNFFYGVSVDPESNLGILEANRIMKTDIKNRSDLQWQEQGKHPSEPVFVANPIGTGEDDGAILYALTHSHEPNATTLLILDAKNLKEIARVGFETVGAFTSTFHGCWDDGPRLCHNGNHNL